MVVGGAVSQRYGGGKVTMGAGICGSSDPSGVHARREEEQHVRVLEDQMVRVLEVHKLQDDHGREGHETQDRELLEFC